MMNHGADAAGGEPAKHGNTRNKAELCPRMALDDRGFPTGFTQRRGDAEIILKKNLRSSAAICGSKMHRAWPAPESVRIGVPLWLKKLCASAPQRETLPDPSAAGCGHLRLKNALACITFALFAPFCSAAPSDPLDSLIKRPLFQPDKSAASAATTTAAPSRIEFGGFLVQGGKPEISLTDLTTGRGYFVALRDPKAPYFVETLDQDTPTVTLRLKGQTITLKLRQSTGEAPGTAAQPATTPTQAVVNDPATGKNPADPTEAGKPKTENAGSPSEPNRIPRQTLKIPPRVDDPK